MASYQKSCEPHNFMKNNMMSTKINTFSIIVPIIILVIILRRKPWFVYSCFISSTSTINEMISDCLLHIMCFIFVLTSAF